jgi:hypothetical protein
MQWLKNKLITARIRLSMLLVKILNTRGFNVASMSDYYSVLPVTAALKQNERRWFKPSSLMGIKYDLDGMRQLVLQLTSRYSDDYNELPNYETNKAKGYGPGYTAVDARFLYYILRDTRPRHYIEVGSGLSTYYCSLACQRNTEAGAPVSITCIEPFPY